MVRMVRMGSAESITVGPNNKYIVLSKLTIRIALLTIGNENNEMDDPFDSNLPLPDSAILHPHLQINSVVLCVVGLAGSSLSAVCYVRISIALRMRYV